jgi:hypothetical protein
MVRPQKGTIFCSNLSKIMGFLVENQHWLFNIIKRGGIFLIGDSLRTLKKKLLALLFL